VIVSRDLQRMLRVAAIAPTLQAAIDRWAELRPALEERYRQLCAGTERGEVFDSAQALSPLPRAYQWCDGSVYKAHNERMAKWINKPIDPRYYEEPAMYQGASDAFLAPTEDIPASSEDWGIDYEAEIAVITDRVPYAVKPEAAGAHIVLLMLCNHLGVLNAVAEKVGWGKPADKGRFRGLAQHMGYGSYVAAAAEVSVDPKGQLKIHRIVAATNCGNAVNPQQIEAQIQGSFVYGLSALLYQECTVKNGRIEQENFDSYNVMRIDEMPVVETIVMPSGDFWGGVGEPTIFVAAPAVLNALYAATGKRIRSFPLSKHDLKSA
jgi:2-keto-4-pentenoate hydratase/2-oxohepta-3-ene-1,7-dioic acid hydratase in catechol pathway